MITNKVIISLGVLSMIGTGTYVTYDWVSTKNDISEAEVPGSDASELSPPQDSQEPEESGDGGSEEEGSLVSR